MLDIWIIAGVLFVGGAVAAIALASRRPTEAEPAIVELDEVAIIKSRMQVLLALEEDLIAAGQALGRVRRFLVDPEEAGPVVDELRECLSDLWLRRFDYEGCLRLATLRRRLPDPPALGSVVEEMSALDLEERMVMLQELADGFREVARRADDSARMFRRLLPGEDAHARWVGDAVDVAREWRLAQTEEILRFSGRVNSLADHLQELTDHLEELRSEALLSAEPGLGRDEVMVPTAGLQERLLGLVRVGLEEKKMRELVLGAGAELDTEKAIEAARVTVQEVRALARKAGGTRTTRAPEVPGADGEAADSAPA